jgi:hypothetical protein
MSNDAQLRFLSYPEDIRLPERDQPVNRVLHDRPATCNNVELLQALIDGPKAEIVAAVSGLGEKGAIHLKAALELGSRTLHCGIT